MSIFKLKIDCSHNAYPVIDTAPIQGYAIFETLVPKVAGSKLGPRVFFYLLLVFLSLLLSLCSWSVAPRTYLLSLVRTLHSSTPYQRSIIDDAINGMFLLYSPESRGLQQVDPFYSFLLLLSSLEELLLTANRQNGHLCKSITEQHRAG